MLSLETPLGIVTNSFDAPLNFIFGCFNALIGCVLEDGFMALLSIEAARIQENLTKFMSLKGYNLMVSLCFLLKQEKKGEEIVFHCTIHQPTHLQKYMCILG